MGNRLIDQKMHLRLCAINAQQGQERRFTRFSIFLQGFARKVCIAFSIEHIIGNQKGKANIPRIVAQPIAPMLNGNYKQSCVSLEIAQW